MQNEESNINWKELINKFSSYEGTLVDYCRKNNITENQFYYYRKKFKNKNENKTKTIFHPITVEKKETDKIIKDNTLIKTRDIKVEIGKITIHIPSEDTANMLNILKEIMTIC